MNVAIVAQNNINLVRKIKSLGFKIVEENPEMIISIGGDGTILLSERLYPSVPKLVLKTSSTCRKCEYTINQLKTILDLIKQGKYVIEEEKKVEARFKKQKILALNEIQLHNKKPTVALRFSVTADTLKQENVIGDGLIIASPFGSTGYYMSVVGKSFRKGIGIAFNNPHNIRLKGFVLKENVKIVVRVLREEGWLIRDNDENFIDLYPGDKFKVFLSKERAKFIKVYDHLKRISTPGNFLPAR
ncbi:MAG: hypothetical protein NZ893_00460 [Candidatus Aenigmarchaeota archaeon]|nr:hypothetical protein [Candidatus Aenigmarchaeota archaeon]